MVSVGRFLLKSFVRGGFFFSFANLKSISLRFISTRAETALAGKDQLFHNLLLLGLFASYVLYARTNTLLAVAISLPYDGVFSTRNFYPYDFLYPIYFLKTNTRIFFYFCISFS